MFKGREVYLPPGNPQQVMLVGDLVVNEDEVLT